VGGFLVTERNEVTGKMIVREKNAHAWVEAWIDGSWQTVDPTPYSGLALHMDKKTPAFSAYVDWLGDQLSQILRFAKTRPLWHYFVLGLFAIAYLLRNELRQWWKKRSDTATSHEAIHPRPAPFIQSLFDGLKMHGYEKAASETVESFAIRLRESELEEGEQAADVLLRYAALRYGGHGNEADVSKAASELKIQPS
jgi:hypothetical protein